MQGVRGPTVGCCSTYLGPRGVTRGDQGGGALLHQVREIGVAKEQISVAGETIAGGRAPPPFPMFLEKERQGRAAARLGLTGEEPCCEQVCLC